MNKAKWSTSITVIDPDTKDNIELAVYKHENGGMFAIDASYIEQLDGISDDDDITCRIPDPFNKGRMVELHED